MSEKLNVSASIQINDIDLTDGAYVSRSSWQGDQLHFNTRMFLNALIQHSTDTGQVSSNIGSTIHRPLSDIFLVYNERRFETTGDLIDRAIIAKVTYMMQF